MPIRISRRLLLLIAIILLALAVPLTLYLLSKQQDIRQHAASSADLVITGLQLTDAGGNVRTTFGINEDIYIRVRIKNQGTQTGVSTDGFTYTQIYSHAPSPVPANTVSPDGIYLRNGQFSAGYEKTYESRWAGLNSNAYKDKIFFKKSTAGKYTARAYVNYNGNVDESNINNNQEATIQYTVTNFPTSQGVYQDGAIGSTPPSTSVQCGETGTLSGVTACYYLGPVAGNGWIKFTNNSSSPRAVGAALYKAYYDFPNPYPSCDPSICPDQFIWIWTQTIYSAKLTTLDPGQTRYISLPAPSCNWQIDAFLGSNLYLSFHPPSQTYGQQGKLIGGGWLEQYGSLNACSPTILQFPSPTPTPTIPPPSLTPTPSPTLPPGTPTPTITLTPTPTVTETPTPTGIPPFTGTPTPTDIPACPVPSQVQNVRIDCPFCGQ